MQWPAFILMQLLGASLLFMLVQQLIREMLPYPSTLFEHLRAIFIFDKAQPKASLCIADFWRVEMVSTSLSPAVRFFSSLKCDLPCDWFTPTISQIMVHFRALMHHLLCLRAFLNTAEVCCPPFSHTYNIQLINNGQVANNRIPELWHFGMHCRLMSQGCMHAITARNMPASKTFNIQFLSVPQQKGVCRVPVFPRGDLSNCGSKEWCLDFFKEKIIIMQQAGDER